MVLALTHTQVRDDRGDSDLTSFVLVHGAWHGGWCWRQTAERLRADGHEVLTPTLTGLGERRHLMSESVDLALHIEDVANVLFFEDLEDVVLVGHSYAGLVIPGVANKHANRIRHLVFLDASTPEDGRRIIDMLPASRRDELERALEGGEYREWPVIQDNPFGVFDPRAVDWLTKRLVPHPMTRSMLYSEIPSMTAEALAIPRSFINCTMSPDPDRARVLQGQGYSYRELATGHDAMVTAPEKLVALISECL